MKGTRKEVYLEAMKDGFQKASSMYIKPGTLVKISTLLKEAERDEKEGIVSVWEYDNEKEFITECSEFGPDEHYLWK